jgi:lipopolysaccharide transport system ATP-binding protein
VAPKVDAGQFLIDPVRPGRVYPTLYVTREQFERVELPPRARAFVVIRDLRDTLVSAYFSILFSHPTLHESIPRVRGRLSECSKEDGLLFLLDEWLDACAQIQSSWLEASEPIIRYEDLLERDYELLWWVLLRRCELPVEAPRLRTVVESNRFEVLTGGRCRGDEDPNSHERKGVSGDWRNHFSPRVTDEFKARYGALLIAAGYESDTDW